MGDRKKSSAPTGSTATATVTATVTAQPTAQRTTSWSNIVALENDAAAVVAADRPLPDSARGLLDVAQKAKKARP